MSIPTTSLLPTVFWTGSEAARNHPAYLEVPDRIERSIAELQSAAFAAWLRNLMVRKVRFELTRPFGHQGLGLTRLPFRHMRTLVGREGLGPSVFLMSRVYSPLVSPLTTPTHMVAGAGFEPAYVGL